MNVLQESRVIQLNKMIGLSPKARPSTEEVINVGLSNQYRVLYRQGGITLSVLLFFTVDHSQTAS